MNLFDLDDRVTAAAVAAAGTVIGALIQLRVAWRKEVSARARGVPITKKSRRGPVLAVFMLLLAASVGGFAFCQYLVNQTERESAALRGELNTQIAQISATAERIERASLSTRAPTAVVATNRPGTEDFTVTATVGPCRARAATSSEAAPACTEQEALHVTLCGNVPVAATVTAMMLYARPEDSARPWSESQFALGQGADRTRFSDKPAERPDSDRSKQICVGFSDWDGEQAYSARLIVKYVPEPAVRELSQSLAVPITEAH